MTQGFKHFDAGQRVRFVGQHAAAAYRRSRAGRVGTVEAVEDAAAVLVVWDRPPSHVVTRRPELVRAEWLERAVS